MPKLAAVHDLLQQEVNRQEFLKFLGVGLLTIIGVTNILNQLKLSQPKQQVGQGSGYGFSAYGR